MKTAIEHLVDSVERAIIFGDTMPAKFIEADDRSIPIKGEQLETGWMIVKSGKGWGKTYDDGHSTVRMDGACRSADLRS